MMKKERASRSLSRSSKISKSKRFYCSSGNTSDLDDLVASHSNSHSHTRASSAAAGAGGAAGGMRDCRSAFELEQSGEVTSLVESVRFFIDGFVGLKTSLGTRRGSLKRVLDATLAPASRGLLREALRASSSLVDRFYLVLITLKGEEDPTLLFWGYSLVVSLFCPVSDRASSASSATVGSLEVKQKGREEAVETAGLLPLTFPFFQVIMDMCLLSCGVPTTPTTTYSPVATPAVSVCSTLNTCTGSTIASCQDSAAAAPSLSPSASPAALFLSSSAERAAARGGRYLSKRRKVNSSSSSSGSNLPLPSSSPSVPISVAVSAKQLNFTDHMDTVSANSTILGNTCTSSTAGGGSVSAIASGGRPGSGNKSGSKFRSKRKFSTPSVQAVASSGVSSGDSTPGDHRDRHTHQSFSLLEEMLLEPPSSTVTSSASAVSDSTLISSTVSSSFFPTLWSFLLLGCDSVGHLGAVDHINNVHGQRQDRDRDDDNTNSPNITDIEVRLAHVLSTYTNGDRDRDRDRASGQRHILLYRFGVYVNVRLVGLLIGQATRDSCTSASLDCSEGGGEKEQEQVREEEDNRGDRRGSPALLLARCLDLQRESGFTKHLCCVLSTLLHTSPSPSSSGSCRAGGSVMSGDDKRRERVSSVQGSSLLWLLLTYLEGTCFRHPLNQLYLSQPAQVMASPFSSHIEAEAKVAVGCGGENYTPVAVLLGELFVDLSYEVLKVIKGTTREPIAERKSTSVGSADEEDERGIEEEKKGDLRHQVYKRCFPELYNLSSCSTDGRESGGEESAIVGVHNTWLGALKLLVNLTHACEQNCVLVSSVRVSNRYRGSDNDDSNSDSGSGGEGLISVAIWMLGELMTFRRAHTTATITAVTATNATITTVSVTFSKEQQILDKIVYDAVLFLLTLLTNLVETIPAAPVVKLSEPTETKPTAECKPESKGDKEEDSVAGGARRRYALFLASKVWESSCETPASIIPSPTSTLDSWSKSQHRSIDRKRRRVSFVSFLLSSFQHETRNLIQDFRSIPTACAPVEGTCRAASRVLSPPRARVRVSSSPSLTSPSSTTPPALPLDEIVLSTHLVLLLHALSLLEGEGESEDGGEDEDDEDALYVDLSATATYSPAETDIVSSSRTASDDRRRDISQRLPGGSWWLPVRVLKAYIALQDQTATLVQENSLPVVQVIQHMERRLAPSGQVTREGSRVSDSRSQE